MILRVVKMSTQRFSISKKLFGTSIDQLVSQNQIIPPFVVYTIRKGSSNLGVIQSVLVTAYLQLY